jgi:hypothetical protein
MSDKLPSEIEIQYNINEETIDKFDQWFDSRIANMVKTDSSINTICWQAFGLGIQTERNYSTTKQ